MKIHIGKIELTDVVMEDEPTTEVADAALANEPSEQLEEVLARKVKEIEGALRDVIRQRPDHQGWLEQAVVPKAIRIATAEILRQRRTDNSTDRNAEAPSYASSSSASPAS